MKRSIKADVVVIGGGIQGCSTAYQLAKRGVEVVVIEKDTASRHASGVNAGGVRLLGRHIAEVPLSEVAMQRWQTLDEELGATPVFAVAALSISRRMRKILKPCWHVSR
ncbi:MAG: FAD-binding oxidoreductase [Marinobacterium sp.]|nr:FAD-binding oxidoreductase [Marinobacterium sp.]